jgi:hypothetical protein
VPKGIIEGEVQTYYDYNGLDGLNKLVSCDRWAVDNSADTFSRTKCRSVITQYSSLAKR